MTTNFHTFTTNFYDNNIFCPRCLSYIPLEDVERHTDDHDNITANINSMSMNVAGMFLDVLYSSTGTPSSTINTPRTRHAFDIDNPLSRLSRLQNLNVLISDFDREENDDGYEFNTYIANLLGNVDVGVKDINQVSHLVSENEHSTCDCYICLDKVKMPRELLCKHIFCDTCISRWLQQNKKCPVCRLDLEEEHLRKMKNLKKS